MCQWHLGRLDLLFVVLETSSSSQCLGVPGGKYELFDHFSYVNYNLISRTWVSRSFYSFSYVLTMFVICPLNYYTCFFLDSVNLCCLTISVVKSIKPGLILYYSCFVLYDDFLLILFLK